MSDRLQDDEVSMMILVLILAIFIVAYTATVLGFPV